MVVPIPIIQLKRLIFSYYAKGYLQIAILFKSYSVWLLLFWTSCFRLLLIQQRNLFSLFIFFLLSRVKTACTQGFSDGDYARAGQEKPWRSGLLKLKRRIKMTGFLKTTELQKKTLNELLALYQNIQAEMKNYPEGSVEYQELLASLQIVNRFIQVKRSMQHRPRGF